MKTATLKKKITEALARIEDKTFLEALLVIVTSYVGQFDYELNDEDMRIIEARRRDYKAGKIKGTTKGEVRKQVKKSLSA